MATEYIVPSLVFGCIFLSYLGSASAACWVMSDIPIQTNFDVNRYQGVWMEVAWIPPADVPVIDYYDDYTQNYMLEAGKFQAAVSARVRTGDKHCIYYTLTWLPTDMGQATFTIEGENRFNWIVETDYVSYSVQYACKNVSQANDTCVDATAKIWSRRGYLTFEERQKTDLVLNKLCLSYDVFVETTHDNPCPAPQATPVLQAKAHTLNPGINLALLMSLAIIWHGMVRNV